MGRSARWDSSEAPTGTESSEVGVSRDDPQCARCGSRSPSTSFARLRSPASLPDDFNRRTVKCRTRDLVRGGFMLIKRVKHGWHAAPRDRRGETPKQLNTIFGVCVFKCCLLLSFRPSLGSRGPSYVYATAESFCAAFEFACLAKNRDSTHEEARLKVFRDTEGCYGPHCGRAALFRLPSRVRDPLTQSTLTAA